MVTLPSVPGIFGCILFALTVTFLYILTKVIYLRTRARLRTDKALADHQFKLDIESVINDLKRAYFFRIKEKDQIRIERLKKFKEG